MAKRMGLTTLLDFHSVRLTFCPLNHVHRPTTQLLLHSKLFLVTRDQSLRELDHKFLKSFCRLQVTPSSSI